MELQIFEYCNHMVRMTGSSDSPWFCLMDVCKILSLGNPSQVSSRLNPKGITSNDANTSKGDRTLLFVDEPNLYRCIFRSRKKVAIDFQDWVFEVLLPEVRKRGQEAIASYPAEQEPSKEDYLLTHQQLMDQSLAMHRVALSFNKHINADRFAEKLSSPKAVAQLRDEMVQLAQENIELKRETLNLASQMLDAVPRSEVDRMRADYELTLDSILRENEVLKTAAKAANERSDEYQRMAIVKALPPASKKSSITRKTRFS